MDYEVKVIPEQKLGVINCKTPIKDLGIFLSILMDWVDTETHSLSTSHQDTK